MLQDVASFAVIVPALNEAPNMEALMGELKDMFEESDLNGEVVLVDDGSTDGTATAADTAAGTWGRLTIVRHETNRGKTEAILTGAHVTNAKYLVIFDADLQHSTSEIPRFIATLSDGWDIVTGRKVGSYEKQFVSSLYNRISQLLFRVPVSDLNSMKAFDRAVLDGMALRHDWHRFFVVLAYARGHNVTEIDIVLYPRRRGVSKYTGWGRVVGAMVDLVAVWVHLHASKQYMRYLCEVGILLMAPFLILLVWAAGITNMDARSLFAHLPWLPAAQAMALLGVATASLGVLGRFIHAGGKRLRPYHPCTIFRRSTRFTNEQQ